MINVYEFVVIVLFFLMLKTWAEGNSNTDRAFYIGASLIFIIEAFRATTVGGDTEQYTAFFMGEKSGYGYLYDNIDNFEIEIGYVIINRILALICQKEWWFIFSSSCIVLLPIFFRIRKYNEGNRLLSLCMFMTMWGILACSVTSLRQNFGISLMIIALYFIQEKTIKDRKLLYAIVGCLLFAALKCHSSIIFTLAILAFTYFVPMNRKIALYSMVVCMIIPISMDYFFSSVVNELVYLTEEIDLLGRSARYSGDLLKEGDFRLQEVTFFALAPFAIFVFSFIFLYTDEEFSKFETKCLIVGQCLYMLGRSFPMVVRAVLGVTIIGIVAVPLAFRNIKGGNVSIYNYAVIVMMAFYIVQMFMTFANWDYSTGGGGGKLIPYEFIWE